MEAVEYVKRDWPGSERVLKKLLARRRGLLGEHAEGSLVKGSRLAQRADLQSETEAMEGIRSSEEG
jgi:hypothetical protein